ncbi:MAG: ribonuclease Y [Oscillospiraceae bacterium]|jgi:ribonuclease Y|nr:ribonuclease Y [Oscillospiraceae bacterium]
MSDAIIVGVVAIVLLIAEFFWLSKSLTKKVTDRLSNDQHQAGVSAEQILKRANDEATRIEKDAKSKAEAAKRDILQEAKEERLRNQEQLLKDKNEHEREEKERRAELTKSEHRLQQKEESLDKKTDALEKKVEQLDKKLSDADSLHNKAEGIVAEQSVKLQEIAQLTAEQAKEVLLDKIQSEVTHEAAVKIREAEAKVKEESEAKAREYITQAIQRVASEHIAEVTVSTVALPGDEMKGRIIGREGRNIRTLENLTGVDLVIDDTPEAITLSSYDPYKREVARLTLERLVLDGRIQPARIEEAVERARKDVDASIKAEGERAMFESGIHSLHPELVKLLGRMHYRTSYGQNVLSHSIEVAQITGQLCQMLGSDAALGRRAGLLHDIGKSIDHETDGTHISIGVDLARKYHEHAEVIHGIESHHGDVPARTIIACLVQAADAISASRPGARRENLENYVKRLEKLEEITHSFPGVQSAFVIQAGREVRVMVSPEDVSEDAMILLAREIAYKIEQNLEYPGQIKVNLMRETRAVEYAK